MSIEPCDMQADELIMERHYRTYRHFLQKRFGAAVSRISVDAGFLCPHRESRRSGGCIYCNNEGFSSKYADPGLPVREQILKALMARRKRPSAFITYFQSFTNTYGTVGKLESLYREALDVEGCAGIAVGTRPDCIDDDVLSLFERIAAESFVTVEYGLQSPHDSSLAWMNRGHDFACFADAVRRTAGRGIYIGTHLILGIPGESRQMMLESASIVSSLPIDLLKLHQLQVVRNTELALRYTISPFPLWDLEGYSDFICDFIERLRHDVVIQRLFSHCRKDLLVGPDWKLDGHGIDQYLYSRIRERSVQQGRLYRAESH